jgi:hypothetical protein
LWCQFSEHVFPCQLSKSPVWECWINITRTQGRN